ncbi:MAG: hypothetical protein ABS62_03080 [Microbacterium sp. SCN 70-200]|uniref:hypothetical protein n=1 Tax=unclassified Microbacterium TaxID=2609290 RepID=UPI000868C914|nr:MULTISPECIES: hypothetical protein [unclassified Microbacterium]MBN9213849.1 hypothetical protein [Microbacterium sp.]ODT42401.1 MAG: hypothetical protein ABS62_03080 [Microbacterium sp. SCN 70-200]OJV85471.1 MAG: hypothetical protein BGO46_09185 [Microbacterium sp. 70-16]
MTAKAESAAAGLRSILLATAVAGALGYVIQLAAPALIADDASYVTFSVYWSTLYLCVAALSGVQQEVTRAARPVTDEPPTAVLRQFTLIMVGIVVAVVAVLALLFGESILPGPTLMLAGALSLGVVGYLMIAVLSGVLYGLRLWSAVAWITVLDVGIRTLLVLGGLVAGWAPEWIALAVSLPFGIAFLIVWLWIRGRVVGAFRLDVPLRRLLAHVGGTVVAAAAMGVMMNGLPMLLGITTGASDTAALAGLILAITVTRAPIVVPLLALQSYLISLLRGGGAVTRRRVLIALGIALVAVIALSGAAAALGPWAIGFVSSGRSDVDAAMMATITAGAGLVAMMCVTGPALLSARRHAPYVAGWVVAAALTIVCLLLPVGLESRVALTLLVPPAVGVVVHVAAIWWAREPSVEAAG